MKKKVVAFLTALMLCAVSFCFAGANDLEVNMVSVDDQKGDSIDLSDMQCGSVYKMEGTAKAKPLEFKFQDVFPQFEAGFPGDRSWGYHGETAADWADGRVFNGGTYRNKHLEHVFWQFSGSDAEFACLYMDLTNLKRVVVDYAKEVTVKVVYDDDYIFNGWIRQMNHDFDHTRFDDAADDHDYGTFMCPTLDPNDNYKIGMMYAGHYIIGCTLPNDVVEGTEPLYMSIELEGNEMIYNIRK